VSLRDNPEPSGHATHIEQEPRVSERGNTTIKVMGGDHVDEIAVAIGPLAAVLPEANFGGVGPLVRQLI